MVTCDSIDRKSLKELFMAMKSASSFRSNVVTLKLSLTIQFLECMSNAEIYAILDFESCSIENSAFNLQTLSPSELAKYLAL